MGFEVEKQLSAEIPMGPKPKIGVSDNSIRDSKRPRESRREAAEAVGVSPAYIGKAKAVAKAAPEKAAEVLAGTKSLPQAEREVKAARVALVNGVPAKDPKDIARARKAGKIADGVPICRAPAPS